ncbi:hypothetical protein BH05_11665 [Thermobifida fusca]|nr:hypothetical protein BH05_11665 [Thermobifida fusca]
MQLSAVLWLALVRRGLSRSAARRGRTPGSRPQIIGQGLAEPVVFDAVQGHRSGLSDRVDLAPPPLLSANRNRAWAGMASIALAVGFFLRTEGHKRAPNTREAV